MEQNARQQIIDRLKEANNVLVTVSANPSVDQLAACIGFTLLLNKLGKHGTAVFSGDIPSTIEFLKPEETIEKNTDSLRDFIIALDKSKADKLRYKVEDKVVKIFITPYRTSLSDKDLDFSQGDFNVDAVVALGVHERTDLDQAITAHGRILHDATVISVNNKEQAELGAINWIDLNASSLSEMLVELARGMTTEAFDAQMATAFMTGIVAETGRFSNPKTTPRTMSLASDLMAAGANQQLIASKLQSQVPSSISETPPTQTKDGKDAVDGSLQISHQDTPTNDVKTDDDNNKDDEVADILGLPLEPKAEDTSSQVSQATISNVSDRTPQVAAANSTATPSNMALQPPALGGQLTANSQPDELRPEPSADPLSLPAVDTNTVQPPLLSRDNNDALPSAPAASLPTLSTLEEEVDSPHVAAATEESAQDQVDDARDAVTQAIAAEPSSQPLDPIQALGAQPVNLDLNNAAPGLTPPPASPEPALPSLSNPVGPTAPPLPTLDQTAPPLAASPAGGLPSLDQTVPALPALENPTPPMPSFDTPSLPSLPTDLPPPGSGMTLPSLEPLAPAPPSPVAFPPSMPDPTVPQMPPLPSVGPTPNTFGAPPDMNGVNPNIPTSLLPPSQPNDATAAGGSPTAPPPVPPPLMPPTA